ncbi:MAG: dihydrodipicolinate synthase family protein, partial [Clostridia bacterium]|nr:dihydrodipicolinate synthase family protein [Clostridia bacterium]
MTGFFSGIATAMVTPFDKRGVNLDELGKMIEFQIDGGTDALVILGTTGEPATMTEDEKQQVIEYSVKKAAGRIKIIVGTGSNDTAKAVAASVRAEKLGADGVLAVTPYYNKCTQKGLYEYYKAICDAVKIPVIAYNVPSRTAVNILPETAEKLAYIP